MAGDGSAARSWCGRRAGRALVAVASLALAAAACAPTGYDVRVTALRDPARAGRTYWLAPGMDGLAETQLEYRALERLVHKALQARGYQPVARDTEPHLVILLGYGVGPPQVVVSQRRTATYVPGKTTYHAPLAGQAGVGSTSTSGGSWTWGWTKAEVFTVQTTWLHLSAVDGKAFAAAQPASEVWTATAVTDTRGVDLSRTLPALLASAMDYFGTTVPRNLRLRVPPDSQRVRWLVGAGS